MKQVLLIHGGGGGAYEADAKLAESLRTKLGPAYAVRFPQMPNEEEPDYVTWRGIIVREAEDIGAGAILVGHSIGASVLIKMFTDGGPLPDVAGVFSASAPFWHDHEFWKWDAVRLSDDASERFPSGVPLFFYHGADDPFVPVDHVGMYAKALPQAVVRRLPGRDHQLNEDMGDVARDIESLR